MVCRQLGLTHSAPEVIRDAFYGAGSGPIWQNAVRCNGHETQLVDCSIKERKTHNCTHEEDISVSCTGIDSS